MGLFISNSILKLFNSKFSVTSKLGQGTKFSFIIDLHTENNEDNDIATEFVTETFSNLALKMAQYKKFDEEECDVMIVDDHDLNRMFLGNVLKKLKIPYIEAINGQEAVEKVIFCSQMKKPLKCIVMDCNMPVMDGWQASSKIKNLFELGAVKEFPAIIAYTAYSSDEDIKKCYDSGMISYIVK